MIFNPVLFIFSSLLTALCNVVAFFLVKKEAPYYRLLHPIVFILSSFSISFFYFLLTALQPLDFSILGYLLFGSAFVITAFTDAQTLLISRWSSLFLVPLVWIAANIGIISITPLSSITGASLGLLSLAITARLAYRWTGEESIGQGDVDFLAFVGALLGPLGCWKTLLIGSVSGSLFGIYHIILEGQQARQKKLPFGTFLAIGAMIELLAQLHSISFFSF